MYINELILRLFALFFNAKNLYKCILATSREVEFSKFHRSAPNHEKPSPTAFKIFAD